MKTRRTIRGGNRRKFSNLRMGPAINKGALNRAKYTLKMTKRSAKHMANLHKATTPKAIYPKFRNLQYIASGAEGNTYKTANGKALKLTKTGKFGEHEVRIQERLATLGLPYFPTLYESDAIQNTMSYINYAAKNKTTLKEFGKGTGPYRYEYVVMEYIHGKPIFDYIQEKYNAEATTELIRNELLSIFSKITFALYIAFEVFNYHHNDFHAKNCLIKPDGTPVIIDFGMNTMTTNSKKYLGSGTGEDLREYILHAIDPDNYSNPTIQSIMRTLKPIFRETVGRGSQFTIEKTVEGLVKIKTGSYMPFEYRTSFSELRIPTALIERGERMIQARAPIPNTEETHREIKITALNKVLFSLNDFGVGTTENTPRYLAQVIDRVYDPHTDNAESLVDNINQYIFAMDGTGDERLQAILESLS